MSLDILSRFHTETLNITVGETSYYKLPMCHKSGTVW